jgi:hypothetical protein
MLADTRIRLLDVLKAVARKFFKGTVQRELFGLKKYHSIDLSKRERRRDLQLTLKIPSHVRPFQCRRHLTLALGTDRVVAMLDKNIHSAVLKLTRTQK